MAHKIPHSELSHFSCPQDHHASSLNVIEDFSGQVHSDIAHRYITASDVCHGAHFFSKAEDLGKETSENGLRRSCINGQIICILHLTENLRLS